MQAAQARYPYKLMTKPTTSPRDFVTRQPAVRIGGSRITSDNEHVIGCTGYDEPVLVAMWDKYHEAILLGMEDDAERIFLACNPDKFLMLFVHCYMYIHFNPTFNQMPLLFGYTYDYFNKHTRQVLKTLANVVAEIDFDDRLDEHNHPADVTWMHKYHMGTADTFPLQVQDSQDRLRAHSLYQPKYKSPVWKCHLVQNWLGIFIHFTLFHFGSTNDRKIWRIVRRDMQRKGMQPNELYVADGLYYGELNTTAKRPWSDDNPWTDDELDTHHDIGHVRQAIEHGVSKFNGFHNMFHMPARCDDETLFYCTLLTAHTTNVLTKYRIREGRQAYRTAGPFPHDI